jgi:DNA polymerase III subunit delta'
MFEDIAGHKKQIEILTKALNKGSLAHAYVFAGPDRVGKKTLAKKLAQALLCEQNQACGICPQCKTFITAANADLLEVGSAEGIKIEQIRELSYKLALKPYLAKHKVAIIDDADQMTTEAANALLKVLEEPKSFTYIILITSNPNRFPKTISSRCQKITFGPVEFSEYERLLPAGLPLEQKKLIQTMAGGKPGVAWDLVRDENYLAELHREADLFQIFMEGSEADRLISAYEIAELETEEIKKMLEAWIIKLQYDLHQQASKSLARKIFQLSASRRFLDQNVNSKLLLTNLILNT